MVVLKKVKSATLIEALVATVLIVIIFVIASLVLNNLVLNTFSKNTHAIENRINELEYELQNKIIKLPYQENYKGWDIDISLETVSTKKTISISAINSTSKKEITKQQIVWLQEN
jgi:predicted PurR-regulated permease PerM